jgi:hypothetical protein
MPNLKNLISQNNNTHIWNFSRVGGVNRVNLDTGLDLVHLEDLDQKLWTALSCAVYRNCPRITLSLIRRNKS